MVFSSAWKMANFVPIHKKKQWTSCKFLHTRLTLLAICGEIFQRSIYDDEMYPYLIGNNPMSQNQSSFKQGDSCINQFLSITCEIYSSFDNGFVVRWVLLDIWKAFDMIWHECLISNFRIMEFRVVGFAKPLDIPKTVSRSKRPAFVLERCNCRCFLRFNIGASSFSNVQQWFTWRSYV